jgi:hypothetical protein
MKREGRSRIKGVDVHTDKTLSKQPIFSSPFFLGENRQAKRWVNWQAGGVISRMCAILNASCNTPPISIHTHIGM